MRTLPGLLRTRTLERCFVRAAWRRNCSATAYKHLDGNASLAGLDKEVLEGILGYPTPIMRLRTLLGNHLTSLSAHIRRLLSSQHPVVKNSWKLFGDSQVVLGHGPFTLLVSKATNLFNKTLRDTDQFGILPSQRALVEVMEMISGAHLIHSEVVDVGGTKAVQQNEAESICSRSDLTFGNKTVILGGDLLLARACKELAQLYRPQVVGLISQSISDMVAGSMWQVSALPSDASIGSDSVSSSFSHASFSRSTRPEKGDFQDRFRSYWHHASLLANGCGSAALLAELEGDMASQAAGFGRHFAVAQQSCNDYTSLLQRSEDGDKVLWTELWSSWYRRVCLDHCDSALSALDRLPPSDPKTFLSGTVTSLVQSVSS